MKVHIYLVAYGSGRNYKLRFIRSDGKAWWGWWRESLSLNTLLERKSQFSNSCCQRASLIATLDYCEFYDSTSTDLAIPLEVRDWKEFEAEMKSIGVKFS